MAIGRSDTAVGPHEFEIEIFLNYLVRDYSLARHLPPFLRFPRRPTLSRQSVLITPPNSVAKLSISTPSLRRACQLVFANKHKKILAAPCSCRPPLSPSSNRRPAHCCSSCGYFSAASKRTHPLTLPSHRDSFSRLFTAQFVAIDVLSGDSASREMHFLTRSQNFSLLLFTASGWRR